jgi:hypothetical protein
MAKEYTEFTIRPLPHGWDVRNLFYDRNKSVWYCRLHEIKTAVPITEWFEILGTGATMQIAFDNAVKLVEAKQQTKEA